MSDHADPAQEAVRLLTEASQAIAQGRFGDAITSCRDAATLIPNAPEPYHGMAAAFARVGAIDDALAALSTATELAPADPKYRIEKARLLAAAGRDAALDQELSAAGDGVSDDLNLLNLWGLGLCRLQRFDEAAAKFQAYLERDPDNPSIHRNLSLAYLGLGEMDKAVKAFSASAVPLDAAAVTPVRDMEVDYVEISKDYDANALNVGIVDRMKDFFAELPALKNPAVSLECCCGTGLAGVRMQGRFARLVGIDLSPAMLERAETTGAYDELIQGDMVTEMAKLEPGFELVFASNAIMYFPALDGFFSEAARLLSPGGYLVFTTDPSSDDADVRQVEPGEYAHSRAYLRRLAADNGFSEVALEIREHRAYPGYWCAFQK